MKIAERARWFWAFTAICAGMLIPLVASGNHGQLPHWVDESKDNTGMPCCGESDCVRVYSAFILKEEGNLVLVSIEGRLGSIYRHRLIRTCVQGRPESFICTYIIEEVGGNKEMCLLRKLDGSIGEIRVTPECIRCLLMTACDDSFS